MIFRKNSFRLHYSHGTVHPSSTSHPSGFRWPIPLLFFDNSPSCLDSMPSYTTMPTYWQTHCLLRLTIF